MERDTSVSYTHLDVYKRQDYAREHQGLPRRQAGERSEKISTQHGKVRRKRSVLHLSDSSDIRLGHQHHSGSLLRKGSSGRFRHHAITGAGSARTPDCQSEMCIRDRP